MNPLDYCQLNYDIECKTLIPLVATVPSFVTFFLGVLLSRFTMSKKERADANLSQVELSNQLNDKLQEAYQGYIATLAAYKEQPNSPTLNDIIKIMSSGESYFNCMKNVCSALLNKTIPEETAKMQHLPTIKETFERLIPAHYETLKKIAEKYQIPYTGEHRKENYLAIHEVYDRYCTGESPD